MRELFLLIFKCSFYGRLRAFSHCLPMSIKVRNLYSSNIVEGFGVQTQDRIRLSSQIVTVQILSLIEFVDSMSLGVCPHQNIFKMTAMKTRWGKVQLQFSPHVHEVQWRNIGSSLCQRELTITYHTPTLRDFISVSRASRNANQGWQCLTLFCSENTSQRNNNDEVQRILSWQSNHLMRIKFYGGFDVPGVLHCVIGFLGESLLNQDFVDMNFFPIGIKQVHINCLIPRPERKSKQNTTVKHATIWFPREILNVSLRIYNRIKPVCSRLGGICLDSECLSLALGHWVCSGADNVNFQR